MLRYAVAAVALGMAAPAQALGSSLRFDSAVPQDPDESAPQTVTLSYPSGTINTYSWTQTTPGDISGTYRRPFTETVTKITGHGPLTDITVTIYTVTVPMTVTITQSGTQITVSEPTATYPSGTATGTIWTSKTELPAERSQSFAGLRSAVREHGTWREWTQRAAKLA